MNSALVSDATMNRMRALANRMSSNMVRVRLLIAIPALIVLLLVVMATAFYWMTESYMADGRPTSPTAMQEFSRDWLILLGFFILVGAVIGYAMAFSLTLPIKSLIQISQRIAGGDLSTKVEVNRQDEMGQLGLSFNYMVEALSRYVENRNKFILESFSGGLITTDTNGTITAINSAAGKMLDLDPSTALGKNGSEFFSRSDLEPVLRLYESARWKCDSLTDQTIELPGPQGIRRIGINCHPMRDADGNIYGLIMNLRSIDELQKFYEQMRKTEKLAAMGTFASGLAHEIRNPLGAIKGTAQLLSEDVKDNPHAKQYVAVIVKEVNRLDALVREVQDYSEPAASKELFDLNQLVTHAASLADSHHSRDKFSGAELKLNLTPMPPVLLTKNKMTQVLLNIIVNALQAATPSSVVEVETVLATGEPLPVRINVTNEGPPIPPDSLRRIFEPFYTTKSSGTGLGLSIAWQVVAYHGGDIVVANEAGKVSFIIRLPEAPANAGGHA